MTTNEELLRFEIEQLIMSKREDEYWDFKQSHHSNTADLLHDVICMANNKADRDAYIIFGFMDQTGEIIGVERDEQRRNQQELINQLKSKKFAGGVRPRVEIRTLIIDKHEIDVLIILNTMETPYYLTESYEDKKTKRCVRANPIYTRVGDTNTDIDKSADINDFEYLWKERFGLNLSPYEKLMYKLKSKETWVGKEHNFYNRDNPEFTLSVVTGEKESEDAPKFYAYTMTNR
nr:ATP-binding protein [Paenibacillus xylanexedens]